MCGSSHDVLVRLLRITPEPLDEPLRQEPSLIHLTSFLILLFWETIKESSWKPLVQGLGEAAIRHAKEG